MPKCQKFKCDILSNFQTMWHSKNLSVYYFWGVNHNMKKEKAVVVLWSQLGRGRKKILHLKGLKRKIPNKWRVNWPAHISFIRHAFKIQQRVYFRGLEESRGIGKRKPLLFAFLIWLDGFAVNIQLDVSAERKNWKWMRCSLQEFTKSCQNVLESQFKIF